MSDFLLTVSVVIGVIILMLFFALRLRRRRTVSLRPLPPYNTLRNQIGVAVESGNQLHVTLGQAGLAAVSSPTSVVALTVLDALAKDGCANGTPPLVTVGEGTLLPAAQDSLLRAYSEAQFTSGFEPGAAQFIAADTEPFAYAAGVTSVMHDDQVSNNVAVGRFGTEMALIAAAGARASGEQVIGTDDPVALALAHSVTDQVLVGEELLAAGAYLQGTPSQIASVQTQDLLRFVIAIGILIIAVLEVIAEFFG